MQAHASGSRVHAVQRSSHAACTVEGPLLSQRVAQTASCAEAEGQAHWSKEVHPAVLPFWRQMLAFLHASLHGKSGLAAA